MTVFFFIPHCGPLRSLQVTETEREISYSCPTSRCWVNTLPKAAQEVVVLELEPRAVCFQGLGSHYLTFSL